MLSADHRMRSSAEFTEAFSGARGGTRYLQVAISGGRDVTDPHPVRVGFVVSKAVGNSVVRHRVYRRLRHVVRPRLELFKPGELVVVRAFPPAKDADSSVLENALLRAVAKARQAGGES